ncbi:hypothetical protein [Streptomyces sp. NPDC126503]|uniref:hypothetical protein n=1 Tax=Streptomyces sp. NPDC126503 TaxID=3155315 RepID=UPI00331AD6C6
MKDFELLEIRLHTEERGRVDVPFAQSGPAPAIELPEGAVVGVGLVFRLGRDIDGLAFEDTRVREGSVLARTHTALGGFRTGGPYEIRLSAERLPVGRAHCGTYEVTGRFVDGDGQELAAGTYRVRLTHEPAASGGGHPPEGPVTAAPPA